jgi:hypothetical protein
MYFSRPRRRLNMRLRMTVAADFSVRRRREARITKTMTINQANGGRGYLFSGRYLTKLSLNRTTRSMANERYRQRCRLFGDHAID